MIIRSIVYVCDICNKEKSLSGNNELEMPEGWVAENYRYSYNPHLTERHICPKCLDKRKIQETFK